MHDGFLAKPGDATENALKADINVTPLVDVCLVLLIIFMLVTPMLVNDVAVQLPETANPEKMPEASSDIDIAIQQDATVSIRATKVPETEILARLQDLHSAKPDATVVLEGDRRLQYRQVRKVMKLANEAGFSGVGLVVHKKGQSG